MINNAMEKSIEVLRVYDSHHYALPSWLLDINEPVTLVHIDAHIDVNAWDEARLNKFESVGKSNVWEFASEPENVSDRGLYGIEDFLYPIFRSRQINKFIWLKPPHNEFPISCDKVLKEMYYFKECEYKSWNHTKSSSSGVLYGVESQITETLDAIEVDGKEIILDIDLDFFINSHGEVYCDPLEFFKRMEKLEWFNRVKQINIAKSCDGGYTPIMRLPVFKPLLEYLKSASRKVYVSAERFYSDSQNNFLSSCMYKRDYVGSLDVSLDNNLDKGEYYQKKALSYLEKKELPRAKANFEKALKYSPNHFYALLCLGEILVKESNYSEARELLNKAHNNFPENPKALFYLILSELKLFGEVDEPSFMKLSAHETYPYYEFILKNFI